MTVSILETLKARRQQIQAEQTTDIAVPLWTDPRLMLRVKPLDHRTVTRIMGKVEKAKGPAMSPATLHAHAAIVAAATVAVIIGEGDEQAELPLDSGALREALGLDEHAGSVETVRAITLRDGDTLALGVAVVRHSGFDDAQVEDILRGE